MRNTNINIFTGFVLWIDVYIEVHAHKCSFVHIYLYAVNSATLLRGVALYQNLDAVYQAEARPCLSTFDPHFRVFLCLSNRHFGVLR